VFNSKFSREEINKAILKRAAVFDKKYKIIIYYNYYIARAVKFFLSLLSSFFATYYFLFIIKILMLKALA
jgi:hypothetical protein